MLARASRARRRARRAAACLLLLAATSLAGCIGSGSQTQPLSSDALPGIALVADGAQVTRYADHIEALWKGQAGFAAALPVGLPVGAPLPVGPGSFNDAQAFKFQLPPGVTRLDAALRWSNPDVHLNLFVRNATGRVQCRSTGVMQGQPTAQSCFSYLVGPRAQPEAWSALVAVASNAQGITAPEPFELRLDFSTLPWHWLGPAINATRQSRLLAFATQRVDESHRTGEPSLKVDDAGDVFIAAPTGPLQSLWIKKANDTAFTWTDIQAASTPPRVAQVQGGGGDSDVAVTPDGKDVYFGDLWSCMTVASSHDGGRSWLNQPLACDLPGVDRQWLATIPGGHVWLAYNGERGMTIGHSMDGGMTSPVQTSIPQDNCARGNIVTSPDGKDIYAAGCNDQGVFVAHSTDMGLSYSWQQVAKRTGKNDSMECYVCAIFQVVALDKAGNVYVVWGDPSSGELDTYLAASKDHGKTWTQPLRVNEADGTTALPWVAAAEPGHVMVAWYQTKVVGDPNKLEGEWYLHAAETRDALDAAPRFEESLVSAAPVQYGNLCIDGSACPGGRNLLDFINVAFDTHGLAHVAYVDGSYGGSAGNSFIMYARQTAGLANAQPPAPGGNATGNGTLALLPRLAGSAG